MLWGGEYTADVGLDVGLVPPGPFLPVFMTPPNILLFKHNDEAIVNSFLLKIRRPLCVIFFGEAILS